MKEILANKHTVHIHVSELTEEETARMVICAVGRTGAIRLQQCKTTVNTAAIIGILRRFVAALALNPCLRKPPRSSGNERRVSFPRVFPWPAVADTDSTSGIMNVTVPSLPAPPGSLSALRGRVAPPLADVRTAASTHPSRLRVHRCSRTGGNARTLSHRH